MQKPKGIVLQERDYRILQYISDVEICIFSNLEELLYKKKENKDRTMNPLKRLRKHKYIKSFGIEGRKLVFHLSQKAIEALRNRKPEEHFLNELRNIEIKRLDHQLGLSEIRSYLEHDFEIIEWRSDKILDRVYKEEGLKKYVPDAEIILEDKILVLEYERVQKSSARIKEKLDQVCEIISKNFSKGVKCEVLIVTESEHLKKRFRDVNLNKKVKIFSRNELINGVEYEGSEGSFS